ncbi:hypothetical protein PC116_g28545 [Phytophthora cactorum]|nr:hypothetical protein PC116_g28545 [Phytophthora cactorum]
MLIFTASSSLILIALAGMGDLLTLDIFAWVRSDLPAATMLLILSTLAQYRS